MPNFIDEQKLTQAKSIIVGIDNGLKGALVAINETAQLIGWWDTPTIPLKKGKHTNNTFAPPSMAQIINLLVVDYAPIMVWLETAQAMPKQGVSSTFLTGRGFGLWEGIVAGLGLRYDVIHAKTWTKEVLKDVPSGDPKQRSMIKCQRIFPEIPLKRPNGSVLCMDGRSDAALIAYFGWMQQTQKGDIFKIKRRPVRKRSLSVQKERKKPKTAYPYMHKM
jgi:hypothetical protein